MSCAEHECKDTDYERGGAEQQHELKQARHMVSSMPNAGCTAQLP